MSTNHYGPNTPKAPPWQQYSCTSSGCGGKRRIPIKPTEAPMVKNLNCEWCGSRQRHRADGGSAVIEMIDLNQNPNISRAELLGKLRAGRAVRTPIREGGPESPRISLTGEDTGCSECGTLIGPDAFGDGAPYYNILAQQLRQRGETHCPECLSEVIE